MIAVLVVLSVAAMPSIGTAQTTLESITIEAIEDRIAAVNADVAIDETSRGEAIDVLNRAKDALAALSRRAEQVAAFQATANNLDRLLADVETRRVQLLESDLDAWGDDASVAELETGLSMRLAERQSLEEQLSQLRAQDLSLSGRAATIADHVLSARSDLEQLSNATELDRESLDAPIDEANWLFVQASLMERQAAVTDLQRELESLPSRQTLVAARIALLETEIARSGEAIELLRSRLNASALGRAEMAVRAAEAKLNGTSVVDPGVLELAESNLELAEEARDGVLRRAALEARILETERDRDALERSTATVGLLLGAGRLSDETAALLKSVRATLPDRNEINATLFRNERTRGDIQLRQIVWLDELRMLGRDDAGPSGSLDTITDDTARLVDFRRSVLESLVDGARQESELVAEQELGLAELGQLSEALSRLIDRRLLWLRTSERVNWSWLDQIPKGIAWVFSPSSWAGAIQSLLTGVLANPGPASLCALALLGLVGFRRQLSETLDSLAERVGHVGRDTYWTTPFAMGVTILLALPTPLAISASGWLISQTGSETPAFSQGLAQTLTLLGPILLVLGVFLEMCRPNGLFETHFNWTAKGRTRLHANLRWFIRLETPAILLFGLTVFSSPSGLQYGLGVASFIVASIALAVLTFQFLKPRGGVVSELRTGPTTSLLLKLLFPIAVFEPLLVGALPLFGFFDTAVDLQFKVLQSCALVLGGSVLYGLAVRMFMVGNRRFALEKAREKRARLEAERASRAETEASGEAISLQVDDTIADAELINEQVRSVLRMLAAGAVLFVLWILWNPLLPALGIADEVSLWTRTVTANGAELHEAVTLLDLVTAFFFLALAVFAVRNIGGLLEIIVFEPFGLDRGSRYAVASVARYVIVAAAIVLGLAQLGANWSELQWVVAALGVGLGFGLQEIVANFVSGLIILFERPIRVGDVVTIGDLRGVVRSIRIRATTITDFDNRQVILPNKTIITENVTNWTLEDDVTRLLLRVGVAYGSDIETVRSIILDTVEAHPDVLNQPPPTVFFMAHGDSALLFEVRLFVGKPVKRLPTTHALNAAINSALQDNGIKIPFPQTDVHVSMSDRAVATEEDDTKKLTRVDVDQGAAQRGKRGRTKIV